MQISNLSTVAAVVAGAAKSVAPEKAASRAKAVQSQPADRVTLSDAAKQKAASSKTDNVKQAVTSIDSGSYTVVGTALAGHLVIVYVE